MLGTCVCWVSDGIITLVSINTTTGPDSNDKRSSEWPLVPVTEGAVNGSPKCHRLRIRRYLSKFPNCPGGRLYPSHFRELEPEAGGDPWPHSGRTRQPQSPQPLPWAFSQLDRSMTLAERNLLATSLCSVPGCARDPHQEFRSAWAGETGSSCLCLEASK